ncbi:hypothetical protein [uncultured Reyranella sp.]|nr:hypothetical protein [uncultured Reyranella sp.]
MKKDKGRIAHRLDFLETELSAIYDLARDVWQVIQELRRDRRATPG